MKKKLLITLTSSALLAGGTGDAAAQVSKPRKPPKNRPPLIQTAELAVLSKAEIKKLLEQIEKAKAPEAIMGAMCYEPMPLPDRLEYVCPVCGEKTLYAKDVAWEWTGELEACRRLFKDLPKHEAMSLDESSFCKKCQPDAKTPTLCLRIHFDEGKAKAVPGIKSDDLRLLKGFLSGGLTYETFNEAKLPLKNKMARLRKLLGIKDE
jgi:hypothetical protein